LGKQPVTVKVKERDPQGNVIGEHEIETHRNAWDAQKTDQHKVLDTVAATLIKSKVHDPIMQQVLIANVQEKIQAQAAKGDLPSVYLYDKNALSLKNEYEQKIPIKEQSLEKNR
jgi:hypothetical protein